MKRAAAVMAFGVACPVLAHATIYKCVDAHVTAYQSAPCSKGEAQTVISAPSATAAPVRERQLAWRRTAVAPGISDDEVLNMPGWGVPDRIERWREGRVPHESWLYERPDGSARVLHFANARLTGMDTERAYDARLAGFALR
jgi:hypothetical protein